MRKTLSWVAIGLLVAGALVAQSKKKIYSNSYEGSAPPEIAIPVAHWVNADPAPSLAALVGRVVWVEFSFLG